MFKILIVEDDTLTVSTLKKRIIRNIPQVQVDTAQTVLAALACLQESVNDPYHAIIIDFKLPYENVGDHDEVDESVCGLAMRLMPNALIIHITAWKDDPHIVRHLEEVHEVQFGNKAIRLWKLDVDDPGTPTVSDKIISALRAELYGQRVMDLLRSLFNLEGRARFSASGNRGRFVRSVRTGHSRTHEVGSVTREIAACWPHLSPDVKHQVKAIFSVREIENKVIVSLFRSPQAQRLAAHTERVSKATGPDKSFGEWRGE